MVFRNILTKAAPIARGLSTSAVRMHDTRGIVGPNLPFPIDNRYKLFVIFAIYFGSAFSLPFLTLRHMILSKNQ